MFLMETGEGRAFTICKQRWRSGCLRSLDIPLDLPFGRGDGAEWNYTVHHI